MKKQLSLSFFSLLFVGLWAMEDDHFVTSSQNLARRALRRGSSLVRSRKAVGAMNRLQSIELLRNLKDLGDNSGSEEVGLLLALSVAKRVLDDQDGAEDSTVTQACSWLLRMGKGIIDLNKLDIIMSEDSSSEEGSSLGSSNQ